MVAARWEERPIVVSSRIMTGLTMGGFISYENQRGNGGKDKRYCDVLSSFKPERVPITSCRRCRAAVANFASSYRARARGAERNGGTSACRPPNTGAQASLVVYIHPQPTHENTGRSAQRATTVAAPFQRKAPRSTGTAAAQRLHACDQPMAAVVLTTAPLRPHSPLVPPKPP